jgi:hypothetical protein
MTKLDYLSIEIKVQTETVLVILIHSDGTINRKGDGSQNPDLPFAIGMGDTREIFEKLNPLVSNDFENHMNGVFDDPGKKGKECSLEIRLGMDSKSTGSRFIYGADSMGPPKSVSDFVVKALELTEGWYNRAGKNAEVQKGKTGDHAGNKFFGLNNKTLISTVSVVGTFLILIFHAKIWKFIKEGSGQNGFIEIWAGLIVVLYIVVLITRNIKK